MKYKFVQLGDELAHVGSGRRVIVRKKHDHVLCIDVLWLDTHEVVERVSPSEFVPVKNRSYVPK